MNMTASEAAQRKHDEQNLLRKVEDLAKENIFINRLLSHGSLSNWSTLQTLAQMVVMLAESNNRLQNELLNAEYKKAFSISVSLDNACIENLKPLLEAAYWYGEETGDYGMENIAEDENIVSLVASIATGINKPLDKKS